MSQSLNLTPELSQYLLEHNVAEHPVLEKCRLETAATYPNLAWLQISPEQGSFMQFLVQMQGARDILELGTFTGYSALAFALGVQTVSGGGGGIVVTIDKSAEYLSIASAYWQKAKVEHIVRPHLGSARQTLIEMAEAGDREEFDMAFIDADKEHVVEYYENVLVLLKKGGLLIVDNVLWAGKVADSGAQDDATRALRAITAHAKQDPRVHHNVCSIGDGLLLARKL